MIRHRVVGVSFLPHDLEDLNCIQSYLLARGKALGRSQAIRYALRTAARDIRADQALSVRASL